MGKILKLATHFELYLERVSLDRAKMTKVQYIEIKRAWYGGVGQMLIMSRDDLTQLPENDAVRQLQRWHNECAEFWEDQQKGNGTHLPG